VLVKELICPVRLLTDGPVFRVGKPIRGKQCYEELTRTQMLRKSEAAIVRRPDPIAL
jgi:hypothetical protein